jgi:integrase
MGDGFVDRHDPRVRWRAAARYAQELGKEAPAGFKNVRVHDLRHTFGRRLRAAGVSFEDRQDLLGHRSTRVTTDYSAAELRSLLNAANRLKKSRNDGVASNGVRFGVRKTLNLLVGADGIEPPTFAL